LEASHEAEHAAMKHDMTPAPNTDPPKEAVHRGGTTTTAAPATRKKLMRRTLLALGILAALLLTALTVAWVLFRQDMADARARLGAQPTQLYKSRYGEIQYQVVGSGPTVLVSHGVTGGVDQAESLITQWRMLPNEYRFIYVSRFGYLESSVPEGASTRLQAAAYRELLDHLGIDRVFIAGNSAGGPSAMWFAIQYPERTNGLILVSSAVPGPEPDYIRARTPSRGSSCGHRKGSPPVGPGDRPALPRGRVPRCSGGA
jgi:alpha/beta hydrolase fold